MEVVRVLTVLVGLFVLCAWYYYENVHPYRPQTLLDELTALFSRVKGGSVSYYYFKRTMEEMCGRVMVKDSMETVKLKRHLRGMLADNDDDFIVSAFSDPHLTVDKLYERMETYSPYAAVAERREEPYYEEEIEDLHGDTVPDVFAFGVGFDLMDRMVETKHCQAGSLRWMNELPTNTTALQGAFADAICKMLKLPFRSRYLSFKKIWGDKNYSEYLAKACRLPQDERDQIQAAVREVISNYELPGEHETYKIPKEPLVLAARQKELV